MNLKGKVSIVTGSSRGIGKAIALELAREGADVVINYSKSRKEAEKVAQTVIESDSRALLVKADVSNREEVIEMVEKTIDKFGRLHILVNNAGYSSRELWYTKLENISPKMWSDVMNVDLKGAFLCSQSVAKTMRDQKEGKIINISSTPAVAGDPYGMVYTVAKSGILGLTKALAWSLAPDVQVNAVALGSIRTGWVEWLNEEEQKIFTDETALKRFGKPEEVGKMVAFLASNASDFMTGQTVILDGGAVMR
jgi:3-oxoacyl-[acyl-carrier protein] reductase